VSLLVASVVLLVVFALVELRQESPVLDLTLFRKPTFTGAAIVAFALSASMFAMFLYITLYLQNVLGYTPLETGVRFLPLSVTSFVVAPIAGNLAARYPVRAFLGLGLLLVSLALLLMHGVKPNSSWTTLLAGFVIGGAGVGMVNPALAQGAVGVVRPEMSGVASGINNTARQVGIATGIAALGAIFQARIQTQIMGAVAGTPVQGHVHEIARAIAGGGASQIKQSVPPQLQGRFTEAANSAFCSAFNEILIVGSVVALVGGLLAFALTRESDFVSHGAGAEAAHA
jgi:predicted MFS family arabinose efflux permease